MWLVWFHWHASTGAPNGPTVHPDQRLPIRGLINGLEPWVGQRLSPPCAHRIRDHQHGCQVTGPGVVMTPTHDTHSHWLVDWTANRIRETVEEQKSRPGVLSDGCWTDETDLLPDCSVVRWVEWSDGVVDLLRYLAADRPVSTS